MRKKKETYDERLARYERERREAMARIEKLAGGKTVLLADVAEFLPVVPEWEMRP